MLINYKPEVNYIAIAEFSLIRLYLFLIIQVLHFQLMLISYYSLIQSHIGTKKPYQSVRGLYVHKTRATRKRTFSS